MTIPKSSKLLFETLQRTGPATKNRLVEITDMKLTTLNRFLKPLFDMEWIIASGSVNNTGGRPSTLIEINTHRHAIIGIDISRTSVNVLFLDLSMTILLQEKIAVDEHTVPSALILQISEIINYWVKQYPHRKVLGIGMGMIGPIDLETGKLLNLEPLPVGMVFHTAIREKIQTLTGLPVKIGSGANLALLAEYTFGEAKNYANIAYVSCGVGIRSSVMLNRQLIEPKFAREDTLAHMIIAMNGKPCICGNNGCIEAYSSIHSLTSEYERQVGSPIHYQTLLKRADMGDSLCHSILMESASALGIGISNEIKSVGLEYVILSGPLVEHSTYFYNQVITTVLSHVQNSFSNGVVFSKGGTFSHNAIAIGAGSLLLNNHLYELTEL